MIFRKKLRYVLVEASADARMADPRNPEELKAGVRAFLGELQYFKANPQIAAVLSSNVFVMVVNRGYERSLALALAFVKGLGGRRMGFYTIKTSGTIRSIKATFGQVY
ncbi:MAG: Rpp14/Pop5 family protein [Candidatus Marsarchaeota archaeon]|nr:Rpp14/Pop5 family protein [Candidatus Marsarchaeota archaeon]